MLSTKQLLVQLHASLAGSKFGSSHSRKGETDALKFLQIIQDVWISSTSEFGTIRSYSMVIFVKELSESLSSFDHLPAGTHFKPAREPVSISDSIQRSSGLTLSLNFDVSSNTTIRDFEVWRFYASNVGRISPPFCQSPYSIGMTLFNSEGRIWSEIFDVPPSYPTKEKSLTSNSNYNQRNMSGEPVEICLPERSRGFVACIVNASFKQQAYIDVRDTNGNRIASAIFQGQGSREHMRYMPPDYSKGPRMYWSFGPYKHAAIVYVTIRHDNGSGWFEDSKMVGPLSVTKQPEPDYPMGFIQSTVISEDSKDGDHDDCTIQVLQYKQDITIG
ncbi:hypothetical protein BV22DRAFT_1179899 [Leucogyrophana mollusca]|uniref:Uncharacterized protein n=1 Tax=Leucogyrophana mollusca TaxID=85980 RepID=A0ACB8B4Y1_9AGAM|nr:hypothetical protein BV22DRAFT_1179899 [Leucogyrophana mollusca]